MGMKPHDFWELTYFEFITIHNGYIKSKIERLNDLRYVAWHTALFERQKELPPLKSILINEKKPLKQQKEQTPEEMMAMCRMLNAAFGGEEIINNGITKK